MIKSDLDEYKLTANDYPYSLSMETKDFDDDKQLFKFVKACERLIRTSPEYKLWTTYLREVLEQYECSITGENHAQASTDIHHHPISLFLITKAVVNKNISESKKFTSLSVANQVLKIHFENKIGFIPLLKSIHEKFHNGFISLPIELAQGNWVTFVDSYSSYLEDEDLEIINNRKLINFENCGWNREEHWSKDNYRKVA